MQIVITASGSGSDNFLQAGFLLPKNLVSFKGKPILDFVVEQYKHLKCPITITLNKSECLEFGTDQIILERHPAVRVLQIPDGNRGALCSALLGTDASISGRLIIVPGDSVTQKLPAEIVERIISEDADAGTVVFRSDSPRWSYVRTDSNNHVLEIAEKKVISGFATTGLFYFRDVATFIDGATWALVNSTNLKGRYYVSHSLHKLLSMQKTVVAQPVKNSRNYLSFSSPAELAQRLEEYEN